MTETDILPAHRQRQAFVYIRQSSPAQVERNTESTRRQYALATRAEALGWHRDRITIVDEDLGLSGASADKRDGFNSLAADVALGRAGLVLGLEVSRLARNNSDWYRLLDLCALTETLIADFDGIYDPAHFNDRLLLGLKGTSSEAELHTLKVRLLEGIRNKAARGEFRCTLPVGFVWGERDGEVRLHPDEEVMRAIRTVFERFAELGSMRRVWLWFRDEGLQFPVRLRSGDGIRWIPPAYSSIVQVLSNPAYAGAYAFGKTRQERYLDDHGRMQKRLRRLPRSEWRVLLPGHHRGYIDWETFEANRARIGANRRPRPHSAGGSVREGSALLQGLAICGNCGRPLRTYYLGRRSSPNYHCPGKQIVEGRATYCLQIGGTQVDQAVAANVLEAVQAGGTEAALRAIERVESDHDAALEQRRLAVERAAYEATRAERAYRAVDPENRRVARGMEREWEQRLEELERERAELVLREQARPRALSAEEREALLALGEDLARAWDAPTTTPRDRKELLRALLEEVVLDAPRNEPQARIRLLWRGGLSTELTIERPRNRPATVRTDENTIELLRRLAAHTPTRSLPGFSTGRDTGPHTGCGSPSRGFRACAHTGKSRVSSLPKSLRTARSSVSGKPPKSWVSPRPRSTACSTTGSWLVIRSHPELLGGSASPRSCASASWQTRPRGTWRCKSPRPGWACPGRRCWTGSSAASWTPSRSAGDAVADCGSSSPPMTSRACSRSPPCRPTNESSRRSGRADLPLATLQPLEPTAQPLDFTLRPPRRVPQLVQPGLLGRERPPHRGRLPVRILHPLPTRQHARPCIPPTLATMPATPRQRSPPRSPQCRPAVRANQRLHAASLAEQ